MVDDQDGHWLVAFFEFEPQVLLHSAENGRAGIELRAGRGIQSGQTAGERSPVEPEIPSAFEIGEIHYRPAFEKAWSEARQQLREFTHRQAMAFAMVHVVVR